MTPKKQTNNGENTNDEETKKKAAKKTTVKKTASKKTTQSKKSENPEVEAVEEEKKELPKKPNFARFILSHSTSEGTIASGPVGQKPEPKKEVKEPAVNAEVPQATKTQEVIKPAETPKAPQPQVPPIVKAVKKEETAPKVVAKPESAETKAPPILKPAVQNPRPKSNIPPMMRPSAVYTNEERIINTPQKPAQTAQKPQQTQQQEPRHTEVRPNVNAKNTNLQQHQVEEKKKQETKPEQKQAASDLPKIRISTEFVVRDLAEKLGVKPTEFIKKLIGMGVFATINQRLDKDTAILMAAEYGYDLELVPMYGEEELKEEIEAEDKKDLKPRSPIITIMGHVDHGKTTLLDALRKSNVVDTEAGQITQHIGAYMVNTSRGRITVLDTPGHEAFTAMRANGVKVTDIVVLVVSAVDGVMPQTLEAINHAKAANVPIIVAVNKIDLPTANPQQIKQQLSNYGLVAEEWGGQTPMVDISAKKRLNLDKLLEIVSIQAELMELKANPDKHGQAIVIEARLDPKKGVVATIIDVTGTIKISDPFTVGSAYGKVRALVGDRGERLNCLKPGEPAEILGVSGDVPQAGDVLKVTENDKEARYISEKRKLSRREEVLSHQKQVSLMSLKSQVDQNMLRNLNVVLKTDVFGSLQAIKDSLEKLSTPEVAIQILHSGVGKITESDVLLAKASNAIIIGFHLSTDSKVVEAAKLAEVEIRPYEIIYDLIEDVKAAMSGLLAPEIVETITGRAEIQQIFDLSSGKICGSLAREGKLSRGQAIQIVRGKDIIGKGKISGLKRFKEDVKDVEKGLECGILIEGCKDFKIGDIIEAITREERIRRLKNV